MSSKNTNNEDTSSSLNSDTGETSSYVANATSLLTGPSASDKLTTDASGKFITSETSAFSSEERGTTADADGGETEVIFDKEYEEGDCGKIEALHDLQDVFNEMEGENLITGFNVFSSYNVQLPKPPKSRPSSSSKKSKANSARTRQELTPAPPKMGNILRNKKPMDLNKVFNSMNQTQQQSSIHSLPELEKKGSQAEALMRYEPTASLPLLGNKVDPTKRVPQGKKSKFVNPGELPPVQKRKGPPKTSRTTARPSTTSSITRPSTKMSAEEQELVDAHQKIRDDLDFLPELTPEEEELQEEAGILYRRMSSADSSISEISSGSRGLTGIRTPTLPMKRGTPVVVIKEKEVDSWKSDLAKVTRVKSIHKPPLYMPGPEGSTLQLKYEPPIWPHQKSLIQILDRMPLLTCLVLDGSEIQFLRDLGSHLPSLQTLSVAKCGLRSLDGTFAFPNLRTLIASGNNITLPVQASYLQHLCHLDLSFNPIHAAETFGQLVMCPILVSLKLIGCPVSQHSDFYTKMKKLLPQVKELRPEFYTPAAWNCVDNSGGTQGKEPAELDPSQMMRLHDYIDKEIQKSTAHRESLILETFPLFSTSQFVAKFQKNFEKFRQNLERNREALEVSFSESDSYISDITTMYSSTTTSPHEENQAVERNASSSPFTGLDSSEPWNELTSTTSSSEMMFSPRVTTSTATTTAPKTEDKNRSQESRLLEKDYNNNETGAEVHSSDVDEDFWDARNTHEDFLEDISEGNEEYEDTVEEDVGDFSGVSDEQYLRRYEHFDDIEEGDGDHV